METRQHFLNDGFGLWTYIVYADGKEKDMPFCCACGSRKATYLSSSPQKGYQLGGEYVPSSHMFRCMGCQAEVIVKG